MQIICFVLLKFCTFSMFYANPLRINYYFDLISFQFLFCILKFISLPWNQNTLLGYFGEMIFTLVSGESYLLFNGTFILLFVSICWHHQTFHEILQNSLHKFDSFDSKRNSHEFLCELLHFHNAAKV